MSELYVQETVESMKKLGMDKSPASVRFYFETVALPFYAFHWPKDFMTKTAIDGLFPYRLLDDVLRESVKENPYTCTPEMAKVTSMPNGDHFAAVTMPEPDVDGLSHALMVFTDKNYDFPACFVIMKGKDSQDLLIAIDYEGRTYPAGPVENVDEAVEAAYAAYRASYDAYQEQAGQ